MPWIAALALALASLLAGCDSKDKDRPPAPAGEPKPGSPAPAPAPAPAPPNEAAGPQVTAAEATRRLTELADKICACSDRACAEAAHAAFQDQSRNLAGRMTAPPTPAEATAMQEQARRFSGCLQKLK